MSKGALWGALRILKPRRYQKWKKRPFFDLGLTYHAKKAPSRSSISFGAKKNPSFLRCQVGIPFQSLLAMYKTQKMIF